MGMMYNLDLYLPIWTCICQSESLAADAADSNKLELILDNYNRGLNMCPTFLAHPFLYYLEVLYP